MSGNELVPGDLVRSEAGPNALIGRVIRAERVEAVPGRASLVNVFVDWSVEEQPTGPVWEPEQFAEALERARHWACTLEGENAELRNALAAAAAALAAAESRGAELAELARRALRVIFALRGKP